MGLQAVERYRPLVDDWTGFVDALRRPLPLCVWTNEDRVSAEQLADLMSDDGVDSVPLDWRPGALRVGSLERPGSRWWIQTGCGQILEEASLLPVSLLAPLPGERVLDLCAAPGSKTIQLARAVGPSGTVVANDVSAGRLRGLRSNLDRLGLTNVAVTCHDGSNYPGSAGRFDRVLVDAPCSGEGTLRKNPKLVPRDGELCGRQVALLRKALALCRPGGRVVYSTCTFAPEENEAVVQRVLDLGRVVPAEVQGLDLARGITRWEGQTFDPCLEGAARLWPHHNDTGGFFVCVLERGGETTSLPLDTAELTPADALDWVPYTVERFGFDRTIFEEYAVFQRTSRGVHFARRQLAVAAEPVPESIGMLLVKSRIRHPKLTTGAALVLGRHATENTVSLTREQLEAYLDRATFPLVEGQVRHQLSTGYVLLRYAGLTVGVGLHVVGKGTVTSLLPKRWSRP